MSLVRVNINYVDTAIPILFFFFLDFFKYKYKKKVNQEKCMSVLQNSSTEILDDSSPELLKHSSRRSMKSSRHSNSHNNGFVQPGNGIFGESLTPPPLSTGADILMIDDDIDDIYSTKRRLTQSKFTNNFVYETNPKNVFEALSEMKSDANGSANVIILLDINMPEVNGFDVLQSLKNDDRYKDIPIFMLCSSDDVVDMLETYSEGADGYLVKPIVTDEMLGFIQLMNNKIN